ncbi:hypothetical protein SASPL_137154 [Salvia splendens]|uniref:Isoflavone 2'-hydroxylase n=1 Tax=Salvia splendens TaxID=180675 RepID=A0A8X8WSE0_SALSN|nr:hypothetical protein SASPL_137154 [Salvia splendens]
MNVVMRMIAGKAYYGRGWRGRRLREIVAETMLLMAASGLFAVVGGWWRRETDGGAASGEGWFYAGACEGSLLIAGTDTSSGTMEWALSLMLNNPHVLKKAQAEIDGHVGHARLLDESDLADLRYLRSIITETLRMYPVAPLLNDPGCWEDAAEFRPERFEGSGGCRKMPFGAGRRRCPGEALAVRILGFGLGAVVQCFDWEREGEELVDMGEGGGVSLPRAAALMAYCRERSVAAALLSNI